MSPYLYWLFDMLQVAFYGNYAYELNLSQIVVTTIWHKFTQAENHWLVINALKLKR